mmetsp:Transcript_13988/g.39922  ORF Transcript_13988/g.39922 Transcript_13988/m.39922 type:complete len:244 (+) Transcript_13988:97-828(+)
MLPRSVQRVTTTPLHQTSFEKHLTRGTSQVHAAGHLLVCSCRLLARLARRKWTASALPGHRSAHGREGSKPKRGGSNLFPSQARPSAEEGEGLPTSGVSTDQHRRKVQVRPHGQGRHTSSFQRLLRHQERGLLVQIDPQLSAVQDAPAPAPKEEEVPLLHRPFDEDLAVVRLRGAAAGSGHRGSPHRDDCGGTGGDSSGGRRATSWLGLDDRGVRLLPAQLHADGFWAAQARVLPSPKLPGAP